MPSVFQKLNYKEQAEILIVNAPIIFQAELAALKPVNILCDVKSTKAIVFSPVYVTRQAEVDVLAKVVAENAKPTHICFASLRACGENYFGRKSARLAV
jgi:hypothetical protein